jgi:predicted amidohydrolase
MGELAASSAASRPAVVFVVDNFRLGTVRCLEILFPELFVDHAAMGVDAVLVPSAPSPTFGLLAQSHGL